MDCTLAISLLLQHSQSSLAKTISELQLSPNRPFLSRLAETSLDVRFSDEIFTYLRPLFTEICGNWCIRDQGFIITVSAFGRILPHAPHLAGFVEQYLSEQCDHGGLLLVRSSSRDIWSDTSEEQLTALLLGVFRLLAFDNDTIARYLNASSMSRGLSHSSAVVRYLTIRILCQYLHAADAAMESMISKYIDSAQDALDGPWDKIVIDYRFLSLWEEQRSTTMSKNLRLAQETIELEKSSSTKVIQESDLLPTSALVAGVLLPRLPPPPQIPTSTLVPTTTTLSNLRSVANGLLSPEPLLLTGFAGSGKTSLVADIARQLNKFHSMVTLHLNEQSDAKHLVGLYTSGSKLGTFTWKPGVLTTAVREGRWVLIEDLDRATNEIISTILPLIENGELHIPGRGEVIRAARGFKLIATMRTVSDLRGGERLACPSILGLRFWRHIRVQMLNHHELAEVVKSRHPKLEPHLPQVIRVYSRLQGLMGRQSFAAQVNTGTIRPVTPRDLFKWLRRVGKRAKTQEHFSEAKLDEIFLDAVDCLVGYLASGQAFTTTTSIIAEELHVDPARRDHLLQRRDVTIVASGKGLSNISVGRASLHYGALQGQRKTRRLFSTNRHTLHLLERIGVAVEHCEPLLLVGETGTGKTTCIQHLADQVGQKLVPFNLSQQSESGDLLGGFKPVNLRALIIPLKDEFEELFGRTFSRKDSQSFVEKLGKLFAKGKWRYICDMWNAALSQVESFTNDQPQQSPARSTHGGHPSKRQKTRSDSSAKGDTLSAEDVDRWKKFKSAVRNLESHLSKTSEPFTFAFVEGALVKAVRNGDWLLLDEINLASPDTLEALVDLLQDRATGSPSLLLTEAGDLERIEAHPDFRVFAAMNPATDVGKKDLHSGIRSRFTELYVDSPDKDPKSLRSIVEVYLGGNLPDHTVVGDVVELYLDIQSLVMSNKLVDGAGQAPHFSLRTLTRSLTFAQQMSVRCSLRRALYEGFLMSFSTMLDSTSENLLLPLVSRRVFDRQPNLNAELRKPWQRPKDNHEYVQESLYWLRRGRFNVVEQPHYIVTPFVRRNLDNLIRAISTRRYPILLQGPTSSGKTSMIEYLAKRSGNKFVRINNHEHTDLQEYLGTYISDAQGKLRYQEGILVEAIRHGYWIVLDELNLAPTDILEALNRLLDDNRELLIPETQEVIRPHPDFLLFATQNPAGLYGGRKHLSRAFRNRFLELHFGDIPVDELRVILHRRTEIPESWARRIVDVYCKLSDLRQENRLFEQKSFATLRDLFRWALRKADTVEQLAFNGYMLLAERVRKEDERRKVKEVIEDCMSNKGPRVRIDGEILYSEIGSPEIRLYNTRTSAGSICWTKSMRRLFVLVACALRNNEPVLLVGETGCGKTTVCQMLATTLGRRLFTVNAHQNLEIGDVIGSQRPIRNRAAIERLLCDRLFQALHACKVEPMCEDLKSLLSVYKGQENKLADISKELCEEIRVLRTQVSGLFEWHDGSLVEAMKEGELFLLDEISLADDAVLERLNSVLEPDRSLLLAEKGPLNSLVTATDGFQFLATMNPGGDYGKRELSPALRNRFTEIWVPSILDTQDILQIVQAQLSPWSAGFAGAMVEFAGWFTGRFNTSASSSISIRDVLAWTDFVNRVGYGDPTVALLHGAAMVFIDTLGANPAAMLSIAPSAVPNERLRCVQKLSELIGRDLRPAYEQTPTVEVDQRTIKIGPFTLSSTENPNRDRAFSFDAPTTLINAMRVFRSLQLPKPILIEGHPGVGKTTLVAAIARLLGKPLIRINLSEQTDLMDLFGSDVPVDGANAGIFAWQDASFLSAMKAGHWVLLDEMNLASQSVLEGLNSCLDHRGEVYISELNQKFKRHPNFRIFAAQNPHNQGGGRKGLPASFVNRFTVVYADVFQPEDLRIICKQTLPTSTDEQISSLVSFVDRLETDVVHHRKFGALGSPWEFNLRDTLRWLQLGTSHEGLLTYSTPYDLCDIIFRQRFRSKNDRDLVDTLFAETFLSEAGNRSFFHNLDPSVYQVGLGLVRRSQNLATGPSPAKLLVSHLPTVEALALCVQQAWPVILAGASGSGKTTLLKLLAAASGRPLLTFPINADIDAMDLLGGFEQSDPQRCRLRFLTKLELFIRQELVEAIRNGDGVGYNVHLQALGDAYGAKSSTSHLMACRKYLQTVAKQGTPVDELLHTCEMVINKSEAVQQAQFEWVNGVLVQALEDGLWLVLDNANLCSSSVLDRLNSLLEPNGFLTINEHPTENGDARIVRPHPDFRIFLTMDPRNGELSRAMRNRAIELFVELPEQDPGHFGFMTLFTLESRMYRFRNFLLQASQPDTYALRVFEIAADHLSFDDQSLMTQFVKELKRGIIATSFLPQMQEIIPAAEGVLALNIRWQDVALAKMDPGFQSSDSMQPIHPLNNEIITRRSSQSQDSLWLSGCYDFMLELWKMKLAWNKSAQQALIQSSHSHFDKSVIAALLNRQNKTSDLTFGVAAFLQDSVNDLDRQLSVMLDSRRNCNAYHSVFDMLRVVCSFWWHMFQLMKETELDEAIFYSLVSLWQKSLSFGSSDQTSQLAKAQLQLLERSFSTYRLSSGQEMDQLWALLRHQTASTVEQLESVLQLEALADHFDALVFRSQAPISQLSDVRGSFRSAINAAIVKHIDTKPLVEELEETLKEVEALKKSHTAEPFFRDPFDAIYRMTVLQKLQFRIKESGGTALTSTLLAQSSLLARRPTKQLDLYQTGSQVTYILYGLVLVGNSSGISANTLRSAPFDAVFESLRDIQEVALSEVDLLRSELQILGRVLATSATELCTEIADVLARIFENLYTAVNELELNIAPSSDHRELIQKNLVIIRQYLQPRAMEQGYNTDVAARAWIALACTLINFYVPNRPHDPALNSAIRKKVFLDQRAKLCHEILALQTFEQLFTGQTSTLRSRLLQQELHRLGDEPPNPVVPRPTRSRLGQLQVLFDNVIQVAHRFQPGWDSLRDAEYHIFKSNLDRMIQDLSDNFRIYEDIAMPVIGFLQCLAIGVALSKVATSEPQNKRSDAQELQTLFCSNARLVSPDSPWTPSSALQELDKIAIEANTTGLSARGKRSAFGGFTYLYQHWRQHLRAEQEKNVRDSSLYVFRGGQEEDDIVGEQEYQQLFPDHDGDTSKATEVPAVAPSGDLAARVCSIHSDIFCPSKNAAELLQAMLRNGDGPFKLHAFKAISTLLTLKECADSLESSSDSGINYNIYTDSNVQEARTAAALVHKVHRQFQEIQRVWPEHSTLGDILRICEEILAFRHVDPIAKLLTKTEKLQETIHEWQKVASAEYSAASLYDEVTKLIISWRRLELSTWMRLLHLEEEKAISAAKSWWFVAYENLIAIPEGLLSENQSLYTHVRALLQTLETFMIESPAGQYAVRINLLRQFRAHLVALVVDNPELDVVQKALANFLAYYSRFQPAVREILVNKWQQLEQDVKEVVQLASWKDSTIDALRQSAKGSHRKLFKIVRKFRMTLACPVVSIIEQGLPEFTLAPGLFDPIAVPLITHEVSSNNEAFAACEAAITDWHSVPSRFKQSSVTRRLMQKLATTPASFQVPENIERLITQLEGSIEDLQKATPITLTSENKGRVKQLKMQKRMLLAETLKTVRKMGLQHNLSSDVVSKQNTLASIFANLPSFESQADELATAAEYHFHKNIDLLPRVRNVRREHHGDLTQAEVSRCVGYLEALLHLAIVQRQIFCTASQDNLHLKSRVQQAKCCSQDRFTTIRNQSDIAALDCLRQCTSQLIPVLALVQKAVETQAILGGLDGTEIIDTLNSWRRKLSEFRDEIDSLPVTPSSLSTDRHSEAVLVGLKLIQSLRDEVNTLIKQRPVFEKVLEQLPLMTNVDNVVGAQSSGSNYLPSSAHIQDFKKQLLGGIDAILGAVQVVHSTAALQPESEDDQGWLWKASNSMTKAVQALRLLDITSHLTTTLNMLDNMSEDVLSVAISLVAVVLPVIELYPTIAEITIRRLIQLNAATCKLSHRLCSSFLSIATKGFCTPSEKSQDSGDASSKLEGGTGLGSGDGSEDISKDINADEDLTELAEEPDKDQKHEDIEDEKDAVDMADAEMEGQMGDISDHGDKDESAESSDESDNDDVDDEAGDVDDLDPSTVDEKMWDGGEPAAKEKEGGKGQEEREGEQIAAAQDNQGHDQEHEDLEEAEAGAEEPETIPQYQPEKIDEHVPDGEALDLPEDLNLEGNDDQGSDDDSIDGLGDDNMDEARNDEEEMDERNNPIKDESVIDEVAPDDNVSNEPMEVVEDQNEAGSEIDDDNDPEKVGDQDDCTPAPEAGSKTTDNVEQSETQALGLDGQDQLDETSSENAANRQHGDSAKDNVDNAGVAQEPGPSGEGRQDAVGRSDNQQERKDEESLKRLGETLERWYRQHRKIQPAQESKESQSKEEDVDMADADFEHLPEAQTEADMQALGTAAQEQAKALDDEMAADVNEQDVDNPHFVDNDDNRDGDQDAEFQMEDMGGTRPIHRPDNEAFSKSFIGDQKSDARDEQRNNGAYAETEPDVEAVDNHLSAIHLDAWADSSVSTDAARTLWMHHEHNTRNLATILTEHLRLILAPTLVTKLRGDFRTGKRLNIKRIIPYIASSYKRDKIWMRRSVPSKRSYQIMVAIDDSKSMAEGRAKDLAFETLALVAKALATLEAGELCIVRFGQDVRIAHPFDRSFTDDAGVKVFAGFEFKQQKTDVRNLVSGSIALFQEARARASGAQADLWQLMLVVSDGVCEDHEGIQRLVRRAQEERIMIVFVVVDAAAKTEQALGQEARLQSIMDLQTAEFIPDESGEMKLLRRRYMDSFPFRWWIVVRDVKELPGVLATALRQWFAEVVDTAA